MVVEYHKNTVALVATLQGTKTSALRCTTMKLCNPVSAVSVIHERKTNGI